MSREWKRGEVGVHTTYGYRSIFVPSCRVHERDCWHNESGMSDPSDNPRRPLVVIDPDDRGEVERLRATLFGASAHAHGINEMQDALREFANPKPPMPDEPKRLGAIVSDGNGVRWIRRSGFGYPWIIADPASVEETVAAWAGIPRPVVILSPGWEPDQ